MSLLQYRTTYISLVRKEIRRFARIWIQTLIPPVITISLYFLIFGHLIGARIGEMSGFSYIEYIVPGLIMMSVITNSYSNVASSFFSAKFQKQIEELLVSPTPDVIIVLGFVTGGMCRGILIGFIVSLTSLFFVDIHISHLSIILIVLVLTSAVFSLAGLINAIFADSFDDISIIPTFVLTPMIYLGGVFYSLSLLPDMWQAISKLNPIVYMINGFRYGFLGQSDVSPAISIAVLVVFVISLFVIALHLIKKGTGIRQ